MAVSLPKAGLEEGMVLANHLVELAGNNTLPRVTISVGDHNWNNISEVIQRAKTIFDCADTALYEAKRLGKNYVVQGNEITLYLIKKGS